MMKGTPRSSFIIHRCFSAPPRQLRRYAAPLAQPDKIPYATFKRYDEIVMEAANCMIRLLLALLFLATFGVATLSAQKMTQTNKDETAIRKLVQQIQEGWNAHDAKAAAAPFATDADFVVVTGFHLKGRDEIEKGFAYRLSQPDYKASKNIITIKSIRFLRPDVAIVHTTFDIEYSESGEIKKDHAIETAVVRKERGEWSIVAFQNTVIAPQQPPGFKPSGGFNAPHNNGITTDSPRTVAFIENCVSGSLLIPGVRRLGGNER